MEDETLPVRPYTLGEFCDRAADLYNEDQLQDFIQFTLCGIDDDHQASIDVIRNRVRAADIPILQIDRDYDSVLGIDRQIRVRDQPLVLNPVARFEDTLKANVHLKYSFTNATGTYDAPLHQIPNLGLGKWRTHNLLRVLFPGLHGPGRKSYHLTQKEQIDFCQKGMLPALQELLEHRGGNLPPDYNAEMFRARKDNGQLALGSRVLPSWRIEEFGDCLRHHLSQNGIEWAADLVFLHQIRGLKDATSHLFDKQNAEAALDSFLDENGLRLGMLQDEEDWYVDVGFEVTSTQHNCFAWRTDRHATLAEIMLQTSLRHAQRITTLGSSKYYRDPASHLIGASGFRITPGTQAQGPYEVQYIQAYLTDKSATYTGGGNSQHHSKYITPAQLLQGKGKRYIGDLYHVYSESAQRNFSAARVEVRVPVKHACSTLLDFDWDQLRECLLMFSREHWWAFKSWRALACKFVDDWQREGTSDFRLRSSALYLTAGISWLLNGIHSTPDDGPSARELMNTILPQARRDEVERDQLPFPISLTAADAAEGEREGAQSDNDDEGGRIITQRDEDGEWLDSSAHAGTLVPYVGFGVYWLRPLRRKAPIPRFEHKPAQLSDRAFTFFFGKTKTELTIDFARSNVSHPRDPTRLHNRTRQRLIELPDPEQPLNFSLEQTGHELPPPIRDDGSDISMDSDDDDDDPLAGGLDAELERVWRQFLIDLLKVSPNRRRGRHGPYILIPRDDLANTTIATYQNINLGEIFDDVQWIVATKVQWKRTFDHLWPPKGVKKDGKVQNYGSTAYYSLWELMTSRMSKKTATAARRAIRDLYNSLEWIPNAGSERIWDTGPMPMTFMKSSGASGNSPAPQVLMQTKAPTWRPRRPTED